MAVLLLPACCYRSRVCCVVAVFLLSACCAMAVCIVIGSVLCWGCMYCYWPRVITDLAYRTKMRLLFFICLSIAGHRYYRGIRLSHSVPEELAETMIERVVSRVSELICAAGDTERVHGRLL